MADFDITAPDGTKYRITGETAQGAYAALQKHLSARIPADVTGGFSDAMAQTTAQAFTPPVTKPDVSMPGIDDRPAMPAPVDALVAAMAHDSAPIVDKATPPSPPPTPRADDPMPFGMMGGSSDEQVMWARREIARKMAETGEVPQSDVALIEAMTRPQKDDAVPRPPDLSSWKTDLRTGYLGLRNAGTAAALAVDQARANAHDNYGALPDQFVARLDVEIADFEARLAASTNDAERLMLREGLDRLREERAGYAEIGASPEFQQDAADSAVTAERLQERIVTERIPTLAGRAAEMASLPVNQAARKFFDAEGFSDTLGALFNSGDVGGILRTIILNTAPQALPTIAAGATGEALAGPGGAAAAAGLTGAGLEAASHASQKISEALTAAGLDVSDPNAVRSFMETHKDDLRAAYADGLKRGGIIGAFDALSAGVIGKLASGAMRSVSPTKRVGAVVAGSGAESVTEGAGEAAAQLSTDGQISAPDVLAEVIGGGAMGAPQTASQMLAESTRGPARPATPKPDEAPTNPLVTAMSPDAPVEKSAPDQPKAPVDVSEPPVDAQQAPLTSAEAPQTSTPSKEASNEVEKINVPETGPEGGRFEVMDEIETVDGKPSPTGRKVRVNLDTGEAEVVEQETGGSADSTGEPGPVGGAGSQPQASVEDASSNSTSPAAEQQSASFVIREKDTGKVIGEIFDRSKINSLNTDKYEAVPIEQHLAELNTDGSKARMIAEAVPAVSTASDGKATASHSKPVAAQPTAAPRIPKSAERVARLVDDGSEVSTILEGLTASERRWLKSEYEVGRLERQFDPMLRNVTRYRRPQPDSDMRWHSSDDTEAKPAAAPGIPTFEEFRTGAPFAFKALTGERSTAIVSQQDGKAVVQINQRAAQEKSEDDLRKFYDRVIREGRAAQVRASKQGAAAKPTESVDNAQKSGQMVAETATRQAASGGRTNSTGRGSDAGEASPGDPDTAEQGSDRVRDSQAGEDAGQPERSGQEAQDLSAVDAAAREANPTPSDAQKEAGNYRKGHVAWNGLDLTIENAKGSERSGKDGSGKEWSVTMPAHYGYIKRTEGADGDHVDIYMGDSPDSQSVFVVDQADAKTGEFDEHKAILGATSEAEAVALYDSAFSDGKGPKRRKAVTEMTVEQFKDWVRNGDTSKEADAAPLAADARKQQPPADSVQDRFAAQLLSELARVDDFFQNPTSDATSIEGVFADIDPSITYVGDVAQDENSAFAERAEKSGADSLHLLRTAKGSDFFIFETDDEVWIDVSGLSEGDGGSAIYSAVADYAFNARKTFIGDPDGLSLKALRRRTEAMLSSALKHGTTRHLAPHPDQIEGHPKQGVPALRWTEGDDLANLQSLIDVSLANLIHHVPEIADARYDFDTGTLRDAEGAPITDEMLRRWVSESDGVRAARAGSRTLKRGILLNTLARAESGKRPGLLERALRQPRQLVARGLSKTFYRRPDQTAKPAEDELMFDEDGDWKDDGPLSRDILRQYMPKMRAELDRLDLKRVRLFMADSAAEWQGMFLHYGPNDMEIIIGASMDPMKTIHHEVIHILRAMNLFTPAEWGALEAQAVKKWMAEFDIEARYPTLTLPEQMEEAIAEAFAEAAAARRRPDGPLIGQAFRKIAKLLRAIREVFTGAGFETAEDIFGRVYDGDVTKRTNDKVAPTSEMAFAQKQALPQHMVRWIGQVAKLLGKTKPSERLPDTLELGPIPAVIRGLAKTGKVKVMGARLIMSTGKAKAIVSSHPEVDQNAWAKLPNLVADPEMILLDADPTHAATIKIVTGYQAGESQIVVMVNTEGVDAAKRPANAVVTLYAPANLKSMMDRAVRNQHEVLYVRGEHEGAGYKPIGTSTRSASPVGDTISRLRADKSILTHSDVFKGQGGQAKLQAAPLTSSEAFKRWYGDSKVVDADGEPLVVYHGTPAGDFEIFDTYASNYGLMGQGGYFTENPDIASQYTEKGAKRMERRGEIPSPTVYPSYLSIKKPLDMAAEPDRDSWAEAFSAYVSTDELADATSNEGAYRVVEDALIYDQMPSYEGAEIMQDGLRAMGFDGITHIGGGRASADGPKHRVWIAFDPEQVKSAYNRGTFDPASAKMSHQAARLPSRQSRSHMATAMGGTHTHIPDRRVWEELRRAGAPIWDRLKEAKGAVGDDVDVARIKIQDRFLPVLRAQQVIERNIGKPLPEAHQAYLSEETYSGKVGRHLFEIDEDFTKPIITLIAESNGGLTADSVGEWLTARHAEERNDRIAKINPQMPDGGSGMKTAEARKILTDASAGPHAARLAKIGDLIDRLRERSLALRVDAGLMTKDEADLWRKQYLFYVPLRGFSDTEHSDAFLDTNGIGRRFNVRGEESKRALGRQSEAFNPLQAAITQAQEVAIRAEKARIGAALYRLARDYPSKALWEVKKVETRRVFNKATGLVQTQAVDPLSMILQPNEMAVKVGGEEYRITILDPRVARAFGTIGADHLDRFSSVAALAGQVFSKVNTALSPAFIVKNAMRDLIAAQINIRAAGGADRNAIALAMIRDWPRAFSGMWRAQKNQSDTQWAKYAEEFERAGGRVSFWMLENPEVSKADLEKRIRIAARGPIRSATNIMRLSSRDNPVLNFVERTNMSVDNAVRLSAYVAARKRGWSEAKAASLAKNLTVNFNRRGEWGPFMNAWYPFANASVQGTHALLKAMSHRRTLKYAAGMVTLGIVLDLVNASLSREDEDKELAYDKIPNYKAETNLMVMLGQDGDAAATIWMPYGYSTLTYIGQQVGKIYRGVKDKDEALRDVAVAFFGSFSPINGESVGSTLAPTLLDPMRELEMNKDWLGRPILPDYPNEKYSPDAYKYYPSATIASRTAADAINRGTGGTIAEPGIIDVSPESIDHITGFITGGAGRFWGASADVFAKLVAGEGATLTPRDIPIAKDLYYRTDHWLDKDRYYEFRAEVAQARDQRERAKKAGEPLSAEAKAKSELAGALGEAERRIKEAKERGEDGVDTMILFNTRYLEKMGPQAE